MVTANHDLVLRNWFEALLVFLRQGLAQPIVQAYKQKYASVNYMGVMRETLKTATFEPDPAMFINEDMFLSNLDLSACFTLMLRRWDDVFQAKLGRPGKRNIERLKDLRNNWAHPNNANSITLDEVCSAAESAIEILKVFPSQPEITQVREIYQQLLQLRSPDASNVEASDSETTSTTQVIATNGEFTQEDTQLIHPVVENMEFYLEVIERNGRTNCLHVPVQQGRVIVGRSNSAHLGLNDPKVSRVHLLVVKNGTGLFLTDLRSANGTLLEGQPVIPNEPTHWGIGQVITVGDTWLILRRSSE